MLKIRPEERIAIYFFYDKYGIADQYVYFYLTELRKVAGRILVVVNGFLTEESEKELTSAADEIMYRPNTGYDAWAYKEAFEHIGWDTLRTCKEVIYCNATVFGPIYPFEEMFTEMARDEDLDFWGITFHPAIQNTDPLIPSGYIPEHIQHYFIVYRQKFTRADVLKKYWDELPAINSYSEAVGLHETVFTKYFEDRGFKWSTYIKYDPYKESVNYMLLYDPLTAVREHRSPVIKRRLFTLDENRVLAHSIGERTSDLLQYLEENRLYDTNLIFENIIRTADQSEFINDLNLRYVLPEKQRTARIASSPASDTAFVVFTETGNPTVPDVVKEAASSDLSALYVLEPAARRGNLPELLKTLQTIAQKHKYLCVYNNVDLKEEVFGSAQHSFMEIQRRSVCASKTYVQNILDTFESTPFLGMLAPLSPLTLPHRNLALESWKNHFDKTVEILNHLGFRLPVSREQYGAVPFGACLWLRSAAIRKGLDLLIEHPVDLTEHDLLFVCPYLVQGTGFAPGYVTGDLLAGHQLSALFYYKTAKTTP